MAVTIDGNSGGTALTDQSALRTQKGVPAFSAVASSPTSVTGGVVVKIAFQGERFDTTSAYDNSTYRFQPATAGYYQISCTVSYQGSTSQIAAAKLYKNGTQYNEFGVGSPSGQYQTFSGSAVVYLNGSTDYVEVYGYVAVTTSNMNGNEFSGILIAAA